ncbi:MAG: malto-oligosyltrehalose synthase [Terriglobales bacterium]
MTKRAEGEPQYSPCSTYRLQLNSRFTFAHAAALLDYLQDLGVTDCYTSPFAMARPGSLHGYDVTDHTRFNPEIGTEEEFQQFAQQLKQLGMGLIVDVVPNHMCITHPSNTWWWDVLENGPASRFSRYFDIDWNPPKAELTNKVLLPVLPDQFGRALENQQIRLIYDSGSFFVDCQGTRFPVAPRSWPLVLDRVLHEMRQRPGRAPDHEMELESILNAISYLPPRHETDPSRIRERQRESDIIKGRLTKLMESSDAARMGLTASLDDMNGRKGDPRSFDTLERMLADQAYRLSYWRVAADEINYRRFFDINDLAAIKVEDPEVFATVHALVFDLVRKGYVSGMRIDHPDGLLDPQKYFEDLQEQVPLPGRSEAGPGQAVPRRRLFLMAEKILVGDEELRPSWTIEGTTGYGFLNFLNGLFVDSSRKRTLLGLYRQFSGWSQSYADLIYQSKLLILQVSMSSELEVLSRRLDRISEQHRWSRDFTLQSLRAALREVIACFPVYRSYIRDCGPHPDDEDERHIRYAVRSAKRHNPAVSESVFNFIESVLLLKDPEGLSEAERSERRLFVMRFQQLTGPVMAKGLEDSAFYRYCPLLSLNEVGGAPDKFGVSATFFHAKSLIRQASWHNSLLATSTHDNKRSEDVRARINVLSEIPTGWYRAIRAWQLLNRDKRVLVAGDQVPSANDEYFLYQTLVGTWPLRGMNEKEYAEFVSRICSYMEKALREAKVHTSWISPNTEYESAVQSFLAAILDRSPGNNFLTAFQLFQARIARAGIFNSLSQTVLKITSPGVPDFYQGTEVWNFSLADPDNRRPVDYELLRGLLERLREVEDQNFENLVDQLIQDPVDGGVKLYVTRSALRFRRANRELFAKGSYTGLRAVGEKHRHVITFSRSYRQREVVVVAGRFFALLGADRCLPVGKGTWSDTAVVLRRHVAATHYRELFTGRVIAAEKRNGNLVLPVSEVFSRLPIAVLTSEGNSKRFDDSTDIR